MILAATTARDEDQQSHIKRLEQQMLTGAQQKLRRNEAFWALPRSAEPPSPRNGSEEKAYSEVQTWDLAEEGWEGIKRTAEGKPIFVKNQPKPKVDLTNQHGEKVGTLESKDPGTWLEPKPPMTSAEYRNQFEGQPLTPEMLEEAAEKIRNHQPQPQTQLLHPRQHKQLKELLRKPVPPHQTPVISPGVMVQGLPVSTFLPPPPAQVTVLPPLPMQSVTEMEVEDASYVGPGDKLQFGSGEVVQVRGVSGTTIHLEMPVRTQPASGDVLEVMPNPHRPPTVTEAQALVKEHIEEAMQGFIGRAQSPSALDSLRGMVEAAVDRVTQHALPIGVQKPEVQVVTDPYDPSLVHIQIDWKGMTAPNVSTQGIVVDVMLEPSSPPDSSTLHEPILEHGPELKPKPLERPEAFWRLPSKKQ